MTRPLPPLHCPPLGRQPPRRLAAAASTAPPPRLLLLLLLLLLLGQLHVAACGVVVAQVPYSQQGGVAHVGKLEVAGEQQRVDLCACREGGQGDKA